MERYNFPLFFLRKTSMKLYLPKVFMVLLPRISTLCLTLNKKGTGFCIVKRFVILSCMRLYPRPSLQAIFCCLTKTRAISGNCQYKMRLLFIWKIEFGRVPLLLLGTNQHCRISILLEKMQFYAYKTLAHLTAKVNSCW